MNGSGLINLDSGARNLLPAAARPAPVGCAPKAQSSDGARPQGRVGVATLAADSALHVPTTVLAAGILPLPAPADASGTCDASILVSDRTLRAAMAIRSGRKDVHWLEAADVVPQTTFAAPAPYAGGGLPWGAPRMLAGLQPSLPQMPGLSAHNHNQQQQQGSHAVGLDRSNLPPLLNPAGAAERTLGQGHTAVGMGVRAAAAAAAAAAMPPLPPPSLHSRSLRSPRTRSAAAAAADGAGTKGGMLASGRTSGSDCSQLVDAAHQQQRLATQHASVEGSPAPRELPSSSMQQQQQQRDPAFGAQAAAPPSRSSFQQQQMTAQEAVIAAPVHCNSKQHQAARGKAKAPASGGGMTPAPTAHSELSCATVVIASELTDGSVAATFSGSGASVAGAASPNLIRAQQQQQVDAMPTPVPLPPPPQQQTLDAATAESLLAGLQDPELVAELLQQLEQQGVQLGAAQVVGMLGELLAPAAGTCSSVEGTQIGAHGAQQQQQQQVAELRPASSLSMGGSAGPFPHGPLAVATGGALPSCSMGMMGLGASGTAPYPVAAAAYGTSSARGPPPLPVQQSWGAPFLQQPVLQMQMPPFNPWMEQQQQQQLQYQQQVPPLLAPCFPPPSALPPRKRQKHDSLAALQQMASRNSHLQGGA